MADRLPNNLFADLPTTLPEELVKVLAENQQVRIERIVSTGHASPEGFWYPPLIFGHEFERRISFWCCCFGCKAKFTKPAPSPDRFPIHPVQKLERHRNWPAHQPI